MPGAQRVDHLGGRRGPRRGGSARPGPGAAARRAEPTRPGPGARPPCRAGRRAGCRAAPASSPAAQELGRPGEAAAEDHQHVVVVDPEPAGQLPGAARRPVGGVVHGAMVEGGSAAGRVTSAGHAPSPLPPPCTRWPPSAGTRSSRPARSSSPVAGPTCPTRPLRFAYVGSVRPAQGAGARRRRAASDVAIDRRVRAGPAAGSRGRRDRGDRVGDAGRGRPLGGRARRAAAAADRGVDPGAGGAARAPRVERRPRPARDRRPVAGADRPLAGRHVRPGPRGGPAHHPLPGLPARVARRTTATPGRSRG